MYRQRGCDQTMGIRCSDKQSMLRERGVLRKGMFRQMDKFGHRVNDRIKVICSDKGYMFRQRDVLRKRVYGQTKDISSDKGHMFRQRAYVKTKGIC